MHIFNLFCQWLKAPLDIAPDFKYSRILAKFDYKLIVYMDDILIASYMSEERTARLLHWLRTLFFLFGLEVNDSKSVLEPSFSVTFLGFEVSVDGRLSLS